MQAGLVPGSYVGMGNNGTGCFTTGDGVSLGNQCCMLFTHSSPIRLAHSIRNKCASLNAYWIQNRIETSTLSGCAHHE